MLMLVTETPLGPRAFIHGCDDAFPPECLAHLDSRFPDGFILSSTDNRFLDSDLVKTRLVPGTVRKGFCLACTEAADLPAAEWRYRLVGPADRDVFLNYPHPPEGRPNPTDLFQWYVCDGKGEILVAEAEGRGMGFVSCGRDAGRVPPGACCLAPLMRSTP